MSTTKNDLRCKILFLKMLLLSSFFSYFILFCSLDLKHAPNMLYNTPVSSPPVIFFILMPHHSLHTIPVLTRDGHSHQVWVSLGFSFFQTSVRFIPFPHWFVIYLFFINLKRFHVHFSWYTHLCVQFCLICNLYKQLPLIYAFSHFILFGELYHKIWTIITFKGFLHFSLLIGVN